jgi:hypothetical protein
VLFKRRSTAALRAQRLAGLGLQRLSGEPSRRKLMLILGIFIAALTRRALAFETERDRDQRRVRSLSCAVFSSLPW